MRDIELETDDGKTIVRKMDVVAEDYLSVMFEEGPDEAHIGEECNVVLILLFFPYEGYNKLIPGVTFTIREGAKIVGFGQVKRGIKLSTEP